MNNFSDLITRRRSTRKFTDELLSPDQVELILKAALKAPTSKNSRPCHFIVVEDKEILAKLSASKKHGGAFLSGCTLAVVVAADVTITDVWIEDTSLASIYMQLQAEDLGLGSCWCQIRNRQREDETDSNDYIRGLLNMPYQLDILSIIGFGHKDQLRQPIKEDQLPWENVHIGTFSLLEKKEEEK